MQERYSRVQAEAMLARAVEIDAAADAEDGLSRADLARIAAELGISADALRIAVAESGGGAPARPDGFARLLGPDRVVVSRAAGGAPGQIGARISAELTRRDLDLVAESGASSQWVQRRSWWPDLNRITAPIEVGVTTIAGLSGTSVRIEARLGAARAAHARLALLSLVAALFLPALVPLVWLLPSLAAAVAGGPAVAAITYRRRLRMVEDRLEGLLTATIPPAS